MKIVHALVVGLLAACAPPAHAWGALGHRLVGALAEDELTADARRQVDALLAGEPEPTLAGVSAWADQLRARDPGLGRRSAPWHYVNLAEDGCTYQPARDCPRGDCVVAAIDAQLAVLRDASRPVDERRRALKFVVHFVGDVHQPLHAGHARDKGGNTVQLRVPSASGERGSNLHAWWDSGMLASAGPSEAMHLARLRAIPLAVEADPAPDPAGWALQSCRLVLSTGLYPATSRLPADYVAAWSPVMDEQLRRAGARLARALNRALAP